MVRRSTRRRVFDAQWEPAWRPGEWTLPEHGVTPQGSPNVAAPRQELEWRYSACQLAANVLAVWQTMHVICMVDPALQTDMNYQRRRPR